MAVFLYTFTLVLVKVLLRIYILAFFVKINVKKRVLHLNLGISRISGLTFLGFDKSLLVSSWFFVPFFVFLVLGAPLLYGQGDTKLIIGSSPVEFERVKWKFSVAGDTYVVRALPFASSKIQEADHHPNARGELTLASLSELYTYDGNSVRALPVPPSLITERITSLHSLLDGWIAVGSDVVEDGEYRRSLTFFHEMTGEELTPCEFGDEPRICETMYDNSGKIDDASLIVSSHEGLFILRKDSVHWLPETQGFALLGIFEDWALALDSLTGQFKKVIYRNREVQPLDFPSLPQKGDAQSAWKIGDELYIVDKRRMGYYYISLKEKGISSSDWTHNRLPAGKIPSRLFLDEALIARFTDESYYRLTASGPVYSAFYTRLGEVLGDNQLMRIIDAERSGSGSCFFATKNGLVEVSQNLSALPGALPPNTLAGYSTRQMYMSRRENALWVTSYSDLIKLDLTSIPDTLIQRVIPPLEKECFGTLNFNFRSNAWGAIAVEGRFIKFFDYGTKQCTTFLNPSADIRSIFGLEETPKGSFIIGTTSGLFLLDPRAPDDGLVPIRMRDLEDSPAGFESEISVQRLKRIGGSDTILVCTTEGLLLTRFEGGETPTLRLLEKVTDKSIHDAHLLSDGSLMLATEHEGLLWLGATPDRSLIQVFHRENYLRSDYTHNIHEDSQGRIWLSSNDGLYVIDVKEKRLARLGKDEGFPSDEFNRISSAVLSDSLMVFGGVNGLGFFNPHDFAFPAMAEHSTVRALKVDRDSQLVVVSPSGYMDSVPYFELPADASSFQAVVDAPVFPQTRNVQYRWISDSGFWRPAEGGQISVPREMDQETLELKWNIGSDQYIYSEISVGQSSGSSLFYVQMALALLVVLAASFIILSRLRAQRDLASEKVLDSSKEENVAEKGATSSLKSERKAFIEGLEKKEKEEYLFPQSGKSSLLEATFSYVNSEMSSSDFSVDVVAEHVNLSSRQFHRRIVEETGLTPNKLFTLIRLRHSKDALISDSSLTVTELANQAGYNNPSYFSKKFKALYGYSPKQLSQKLIEMGKA